MKAAIWFLVGFGLLLMIGSNFFGGVVVLLLGLAMIAGGLFLAFRPGGILRKERIIDNWNVLIDDACMVNGHSPTPDKVYKDITTFLAATEPPHLKAELQDISPSLSRSLFGDQRRFLVLTDTTNHRIKPYQIFMSARPYGTSLACDWFMTYKPTPLMALLSLIPYVNVVPQAISDIDLFDQQDLTAYASNAHHCMIKAVQELMLNLNQDPTTLNRQSKGFFGLN